MAILSAMQSAAIRLMGQKPTTFFGASDKFELEITDLVNEVATDVAKYQDWQALTRFHTLVGDGTTTEFALPDDYDRQLLDTTVQNPANWVFGYLYIADVNTFRMLGITAVPQIPGGWTIYGNRMNFVPAPTGSAVFPYVSASWAKDPNTGNLKPAFTADSDEYLLPERLLTLGLVWRWRENKGLDASGDQEAFIKALDEYGSKDKGSRIYRSNAARRIPGVGLAWPWALGPA